MKSIGIVRQALAISVAVVIAVGFAPGPVHADNDDTWLAVAGVAALVLIASQAKKERERSEAAAQSARNAIESEINDTRICVSPVWNGSIWQENGKPCLPTPRVCMKERWRGNLTVRYFETDCMKREGFRLSARY